MSELTIEHPPVDAGDEVYRQFQRDLVEHGILISAGVDGVYGKAVPFELIAAGVTNQVSLWGDEIGVERLSFPPVIARQTFEQTNYVESFPDLMGSVHIFRGTDRSHAELLRRMEAEEDWSALLAPADVTLAAAACHPVYPLCTGCLPPQGRLFEVLGYCFRHEPSADPARMQSFRMQEIVYVGDEGGALNHRNMGLEIGLELLRSLGLEMEAVPATDPFFGKAGKILANGQLENELKIEGVTPISSKEKPTAIMSGNYHHDHFGSPFGIETSVGRTAHSACVAFGIERITLALLHRHGLEPQTWPGSVRRALDL